MIRFYWILLIVGGLPLVVYPFILLANIMSLAGTQGSTPVPMMQWLMAKAFLWSSTLYPLLYIAVVIAAIAFSRSGNAGMAFKLALVPLGYLVLCVVLMIAWMLTS